MSLSTENTTVGSSPLLENRDQEGSTSETPQKPTGSEKTLDEATRTKEAGLKESKWAWSGFDPVKARRARGLPGTYKEEQEMVSGFYIVFSYLLLGYLLTYFIEHASALAVKGKHRPEEGRNRLPHLLYWAPFPVHNNCDMTSALVSLFGLDLCLRIRDRGFFFLFNISPPSDSYRIPT
jgi:hypothetical protein